jgi:disulfide bond formation protein DsbB
MLMLDAPSRGCGGLTGRRIVSRKMYIIHHHSAPRNASFPALWLIVSILLGIFVLIRRMAARVIRALMGSLRPFSKTRTTYHHAPHAESTELHTLTARSNNNSRVNSFSAARSSISKDAISEGIGKSANIRRYRQQFSGWRFGVLNFTIWASIVFVINLVVTVWGSVLHKTAEGVLDQGDCGRIKTLNSGIHILINVLSTILLSGSNYCMQCMSAPTRGEIDQAHAAQKWLDIGVPSFRNLRRIDRRRLLLWLLLGTSSLPLHLLYVPCPSLNV